MVQVIVELGTEATLAYGDDPLGHVDLKFAAMALQSASVLATAAAVVAAAALIKIARKRAIDGLRTNGVLLIASDYIARLFRNNAELAADTFF